MTHEQETENFLRRERDDAYELMFCIYCGALNGQCDCLTEQQAYDRECDRYNRNGRGH